MENSFSRTELLLGSEAMAVLARARVAVFGIGGVGGYAVEALARSGVGSLDLIDSDVVSVTNINRQIIATQKTLGLYKVDVAKERVIDINPDIKVNTHRVFFTAESSREFDFSAYDYVVDAIDTVSGKIALIKCCRDAGTPIISSMGAGNKTDPTAFEVDDIYNTSVCPLARVMRRELRSLGVESLKVVYSREKPLAVNSSVPGSNAFTPPAAGLIIAGEVVKDLIDYKSPC